MYDIDKYLSLARIGYILVNNEINFPAEAIEKYRDEQATPVIDDLDDLTLPPTLTVVRRSLVSQSFFKPKKGDEIKRSMIRHDPEKLGDAIYELFKE